MQIREIPVEEYKLDQKKIDEAHQRVWELVQYIAKINQNKKHNDNSGEKGNTLIIIYQ